MTSTIISDDERTVDRWLGVESVSSEEESLGDDFVSCGKRPQKRGSRKDTSIHTGLFSAFPRSSNHTSSEAWTRVVEEDDSCKVRSRHSRPGHSPAVTSSTSSRSAWTTLTKSSHEIIVDIIGGEHKGKTAIFVKETEKRVGVVFPSAPGSIRYLGRANVRFRQEERSKPSSAQPRSVPHMIQTRQPDHSSKLPSSLPTVIESRREGRSSDRTTASDSLGCSRSHRSSSSGFQECRTAAQLHNPSQLGLKYDTMVNIVGGTYKGKTARLVKRTKERVCVVFDDDYAKVRYLKPSNVRITTKL